MDWGSAVTAFVVVFPAELPDKTMVATLVLTTRYRRPLAVWCGAVSAFAVHVTLAVLAGSLLARLPARVVDVVAGVLFAVGAIVLWREDDVPDENKLAVVESRSAVRVAAAAGSVILVAEFGDLTQLATAGVAARTGDPLPVAVGAWLALATVAAIAVTAGRAVLAHLPIRVVRRVAAVVFALLALASFAGLG
ncbi:MAG TPA: TMEM165/GDT1 family protein [Acidimicrobiales bacterium]|jgi:putative Ca2+/H+ antiporter (TMEM165/GDT1 family)|nr:TMEM165/GDT1 family protein [Acidimicrobiales bacterium]